MDIAPTVLYLMGYSIPKDMDGKVLMEIFKPESEIAKRKPKYIERRKLEEEIKLKIKRLKELGRI